MWGYGVGRVSWTVVVVEGRCGLGKVGQGGVGGWGQGVVGTMGVVR